MPLSSEKRQPRLSTSDSGPLPFDRGMAARPICALIPHLPFRLRRRRNDRGNSEPSRFSFPVAIKRTGGMTQTPCLNFWAR